ncbi:hypothetical protein CsSME_00024316 [Camellia sinensis var. sinensis]
MASSTPVPKLFIFFIIIFTLTCTLTTTCSLPFVVFHGIADKCSATGVKRFVKLLTNWTGSQGYCVEIGNGVWDSWFMPLLEQTTIACEKVKKISELSEGYNIVGLSQGNMVGRGVVEFCEGGPPVKNFISLAGPHAGIASVPFCGSGWLCILVDYLIKLAVYSAYVQVKQPILNMLPLNFFFNQGPIALSSLVLCVCVFCSVFLFFFGYILYVTSRLCDCRNTWHLLVISKSQQTLKAI